MSVKTYVEALEFVLDTELDARQDLICLRPGARRIFGETERDVPLPRMGKKVFSVALGAALQGAHPVLDLRQEDYAAQLLKDALDDLPAGIMPAMTVIACAVDRELIMELPGAYVFEPKTPRQAAGFLRSALKMPRLTIVLADQSLFAEEDEIPEDRSFTLLPLTGEEEEAGPKKEISEEAAYDEAEAEEVKVILTEEAAYEEAETEEIEVIIPAEADGKAAYGEAEADAVQVILPETKNPGKKRYAFLATRQTACDLTALRSLCALLEMDEERLIERCVGHVLPVCGGFELHCEPDAPEGEAAFIPSEEESASLWLGSNRMTISYDPAQVAHADAAKLLRAVKRVLEKPQLLIYDKEYDEA